ncbi:hypothetical protein [Myxococcus sp. AB025B]|uniref:hypothetical protein n=1 Tax=Myxococcus sp. AB025B TaxID=2562794 RepID=UPI0018918380|nr:hypothetical protein [Myxococcus sp. AB025B]
MPRSELGEQIESRMARVCWNSRNWIAPTGEAARFESSGTYCSAYGFGHEEWLFNPSWVVDGWRYGYVQALRGRRQSLPPEIDLYLFAIDGRGARRAVGVIRRCEIIDGDEAAHAFAAYKRNGWLKLMREQVEVAGGDASMIAHAKPEELFDLRFRPESLEILSPPTVIGDPDFIRKYLKASQIYFAPQMMISAFGRTTATVEPPPKEFIRSQATVKSGWEGGAVELLHNQLQVELYNLLVKKYGKNCVWAEHERVDLTVRLPDRRVLIELKTYPEARYSIREALGQLLEYGYLEEPKDPLELVIVSPAPLTKEWAEYLARIRQRFLIPVNYRRFVSGQKDFDL